MNVEPGIQIDLLGAVKRRAALVASVAGGVFLVAYLIAMSLPNEYTSYATMLVEPPSVNEKLVESGVAQRDLNTRLNLMTARILSRSRLSGLIDDFGLYEDESREMTRAEVISLMRSAIRIVPVEGALVPGGKKDDDAAVNTFQIYFTYQGFGIPAKIAQRLAQDFIDEHIEERVEVTQKSFEFIESEERQLSRRIREIEAKIAEVKSANPGRLPENLGANQQQLLFAVGDLRGAQQELATAQQDESFWGTQNISTVAPESSRDVLSPGRRLQALELTLSELKAKGFTAKHPDVVAATQEIEAIRAAAAQAEGDEEAEPMSFAQLSVAAEQRRAELRVESAHRKIDLLQKEIERIQARTAAIPRVAEQLDGLERQWLQLSRNLADFETRRLQAFVQANLERRQLGEQFRILEAAFAPEGPSSPNRILILAIGAILGFVLGIGVGVGIEAVDSSVHAPRELQTALSIPVLAAVPAILFESDRVRRFRKRLVYSLAAATIVVVSLLGGAVSYVVVNGAPGFLQSQGDDETEAPSPAPNDEEAAQESAWRLPADQLPPSRATALHSDGRG